MDSRKQSVFKPINTEAHYQAFILLTDGTDESADHMEIGFYNSEEGEWQDRDSTALTFTPTMYSLLPMIPGIANRI